MVISALPSTTNFSSNPAVQIATSRESNQLEHKTISGALSSKADMSQHLLTVAQAQVRAFSNGFARGYEAGASKSSRRHGSAPLRLQT